MQSGSGAKYILHLFRSWSQTCIVSIQDLGSVTQAGHSSKWLSNPSGLWTTCSKPLNLLNIVWPLFMALAENVTLSSLELSISFKCKTAKVFGDLNHGVGMEISTGTQLSVGHWFCLYLFIWILTVKLSACRIPPGVHSLSEPVKSCRTKFQRPLPLCLERLLHVVWQ